MDNKYIFAFTEEEIVIIIQALTFFGDINHHNKQLTDEQYELVQKALTTSETVML